MNHNNQDAKTGTTFFNNIQLNEPADTNQKKADLHRTFVEIYKALQNRGYEPSVQIAGYLLSEDPTYITTAENARAKMRSLDREELIYELVRFYAEHCDE